MFHDSSTSVLLCVGINKYKDQDISNLSYCVSDTLKFARYCQVFNVVEQTLILLDHEATLNNIMSAINSMAAHSTIYIFYSAHCSEINNESFLYTYDSKFDNLQNTAIHLKNIIVQMSTVNQTYLIIDACNIVIPKLLDKAINIFHPNKNESFEDSNILRSLFINQGIAWVIQQNDGRYSCKLPIRYQKVRQEISKKLFASKDRVILIYGDSGIGKSHFLRKLKKKEPYTVYISIPKVEELNLEIVITIICSEILSNVDNANKDFVNANPARFLQFFSLLNLHYLLIIDHVDHLNHIQFVRLLEFLKSIPIDKILASRTYLPEFTNEEILLIPKLTFVDIQQSLHIINNKAVQKLLKEKENATYLDILQVINLGNTKLKDHIKLDQKSMNAIAIAGGYINQSLFIDIFNLSPDKLEMIKKSGLLMLYDNYYYPHDTIYERIKNIRDIKSIKLAAYCYWKAEILKCKAVPIIAVHNFILICNSFKYLFFSEDVSLYIQVINRLQNRSDIHLLNIFADYFIHQPRLSDKLLIHICETLISVGQFPKVYTILKNKGKNGDSNEIIPTLLAELYWWQGKFLKCIKLSDKLLTNVYLFPNKLKVYCTRGIGRFFWGKWQSATDDLQLVIDNNVYNTDKINFLSYCVLATIQGIRGTDFKSSVNNFIQSISYARKTRNPSWFSLVLGNIGEILWKAGYNQESAKILATADHLSYLTGNDQINLEINRNLLHVYYRQNNYENTLKQLNKLEQLFSQSSDSYVKMQILNTLITHYILMNIPQYKIYLSQIISLTRDNQEYEIYTLANLALNALINNNYELAFKTMEKSLRKCYKGENWLSIKQVLDDWNNCIIRYSHLNLASPNPSFQKWHQILETKLLPYRHHLERLFEYL
ncbi:MAG: ATP-binding protein [Burkholderiales bacterium]|nr:ATP-binding protein [Burkholderiales bacterium]